MPLPDNIQDLQQIIDNFRQNCLEINLEIQSMDPLFANYVTLFKQANNMLAYYNIPYKIEHTRFRRNARPFVNPMLVHCERPGKPDEINEDFDREEWH